MCLRDARRVGEDDHVAVEPRHSDVPLVGGDRLALGLLVVVPGDPRMVAPHMVEPSLRGVCTESFVDRARHEPLDGIESVRETRLVLADDDQGDLLTVPQAISARARAIQARRRSACESSSTLAAWPSARTLYQHVVSAVAADEKGGTDNADGLAAVKRLRPKCPVERHDLVIRIAQKRDLSPYLALNFWCLAPPSGEMPSTSSKAAYSPRRSLN